MVFKSAAGICDANKFGNLYQTCADNVSLCSRKETDIRNREYK